MTNNKKNKFFNFWEDYRKQILIFIILLTIFEIFISATLTIAKYNDSLSALCGEDLSNSCNTVQNSEFSNIINIKDEKTNSSFQIPITLLGGIFYLILTIILIQYYRNSVLIKKTNKSQKLKEEKLKKWLIWFAIFGIIFSIGYTLIQAFIIKAFCKYCLLSAFNTILLSKLILCDIKIRTKK